MLLLHALRISLKLNRSHNVRYSATIALLCMELVHEKCSRGADFPLSISLCTMSAIFVLFRAFIRSTALVPTAR